LAFHRNLRLDAVHRLLRAGDDHADVTTVAADHGFIHFGQFAARYRQRFHELPSETRRRNRAKSAPVPVIGTRDAVTVSVPLFVAGQQAEQLALAGPLADAAISVLGRTRWLEVVDADQPGLLRARYVLRGRIDVYGSRVQVLVRLVEAASARHLWGTSFDGFVADASKLWKQVIEGIAVSVPTQLRAAEAAGVDRKPVREHTAHDLAMRAFCNALRLTADANSRALDDIHK